MMFIIGGTKMVKSVQFEITHLCNLKCPYCYNNKENGTTTLNNKKLSRLAKILENVDSICVNGGEPFMVRESLFHFLSQLKRKKNQKVSLNTNLTMWNAPLFVKS